jgi:putative ABC transport system permease protein
MSIRVTVRIAVRALQHHLLRTLLTTVGMAVGVGAVVTIVALGNGARSAIEDSISDAGTNLIIVSAGNWTAGGVRLGMGSSSRLRNDDADAIRLLAGVAYVAPGLRARRQLIVEGQNWSTMIEGTGVDLPRIRSWPLAYGRFFAPGEVRGAAKVCIIGAIVRDMLFANGVNPVGQIVRIGTQPFTVTGVLSTKGQSSTGEDQDDIVFVPYTTAQRRLLGVTYLRNILVSAVAADRISEVAARVRSLLRARHNIHPGEPDDFRVRTLEEITALRTRSTRTMTTLLAAIAAVSLVVGGVGVMNIMLVSVTERTREIGLRMAVGARARDVRRQFLIEALLVTAFGGVAGIAIGSAVAVGVNRFLTWPTDLSTSAALFAFWIAASIGVLFGWYPAHKAAAIEPIDALRFE